MVVFPPFRLDLDEERLWKGTKQLGLRRKPFAILRYLVEHPRRLVTYAELIEHVWGGNVVSESAMRSHLHELRQVLGEGVIETVIGRGYRFTAELTAELAPTPAGASTGGPGPEDRMIVGRSDELDTLRAALDRAGAGHRQLCFVTGAPGVGKTTLIDQLLDELDGRDDVIVARGAAIEQHGTPEAYLPVIELLGGLRQSQHGELAFAALLRYAPTLLAQVPHLVPDDRLDEVARRSRGGSEAKLVRELLEALEALAAQHTVVVVLEDLQWSDVATIDLLSLLGARRERARLLVVVTARQAEAQTVTHPLNRVLRSLVARAGALHLPLEQLGADEIARLVDLRFPGHAFPPGFLEIVGRITAGTPLFLVTLLDDLADRGMIAPTDGGWALTVAIDEVAAHRPDSVRQLVDMQLDRLTPEEQRVLEAASVVGGEFSTALVAAALETTVEDADEVCDGLVRRALFLRRDGTEEWPGGELHTRYATRHTLVQEVCLDRSAPARRQRWHRLIAERLDAAYGERTAEIAHVLATHFDQGHVPARAIECYLAAAARDEARFASADVMRLCRRARELVPRLPEDRARDALELRVLSHLSQAAVRIRTETAQPFELFERMVELARRLGDAPRLAGALTNLSYRHVTLADYRRATEVLDEVERLGQAAPLPPPMVKAAGIARLQTWIWSGELARARARLEDLVSAAVPIDPNDPGILGPTDRVGMLVSLLGIILWVSGEPDAAVAETQRSLDRARSSGDPFFLGAALCNLARLRAFRGDSVDEVRELARQVLAEPGAAAWQAQGRALEAWADARTGDLDRARAAELVGAIRDSVRRFALGATVLSATAIDALRVAGHAAEAIALADEMLAFAETHGELIVEAELHTQRGALLEADDREAAEAAYQAALASARGHGAHMLALRAANRLAALWQGTSRAADGLAEVAAALARITGGDGTTDVEAARALVG